MAWLAPAVTTAPAAEPITVAEARKQCNLAVDDASYDAELTINIETARRHVEDITGLKLINQTVSLKCACFADLERLPTAPISAVASVKYLDGAGAEQTLDAAVYETCLAELEPEVRLKVSQSWPAVRMVKDAVRLVATAGYGAGGANVPAPIRLAMLQMIADWFRNREDSSSERLEHIPNGARSLLEPYKLTRA